MKTKRLGLQRFGLQRWDRGLVEAGRVELGPLLRLLCGSLNLGVAELVDGLLFYSYDGLPSPSNAPLTD
ncbi:hypothetical protein [Novipirellula caenicola]|uniref:Uncharacterized protein n=1 Tax=Novipirellula caenicola TaxID=1536901 RepID=A0ABP9VL75_9BACT